MPMQCVHYEKQMRNHYGEIGLCIAKYLVICVCHCGKAITPPSLLHLQSTQYEAIQIYLPYAIGS
jgi:hypothetical protein